MSSATIQIKGDAEVKIRIFGRTIYDKDTPFDFTVPLPANEGSTAHTFGPAVVQIGLSGDTVSLGITVEGFPVWQQSFTLSQYTAPIPFKFSAVGDVVEGTIVLTEAA